MQLPENIILALESAEGKALATISDDGVHVVPVSTCYVIDRQIVLVNYFMGQTLENLIKNNRVALAFWKGLSGYQIKGEIEYQTGGEIFASVVAKVAISLPTRVVKGVLVLKISEVYDISATAEKPGVRLQ